MRIQRSGFTIIEVVIAISLTIILVALSLPRYNAFSQERDFAANLQQIEQCIQRIQRETGAPDGNARFTQDVRYGLAELESTGTTIACTGKLYNSKAIFAADGSVSNEAVSKIYEYPAVVATDVQILCSEALEDEAATQDLELPESVRLYFGALEKGVPHAVYLTSGGLTEFLKPLSFAKGFETTLKIVAAEKENITACDEPLPVLTVPRLGFPVRVTLPR